MIKHIDRELLNKEVIIENLGWGGDGTKELPLHRTDVKGKITSIKGISPNHTNVHKYEVTYKGGKYYTNIIRIV